MAKEVGVFGPRVRMVLLIGATWWGMHLVYLILSCEWPVL